MDDNLHMHQQIFLVLLTDVLADHFDAELTPRSVRRDMVKSRLESLANDFLSEVTSP
jgi:hypothetical protein